MFVIITPTRNFGILLSLLCEKEEGTKYDVAVAYVNLVEKSVVGHIPKLWSKTVAMFYHCQRLQLLAK